MVAAIWGRARCSSAYEMNGEPLNPDHGAPVRLIVPHWKANRDFLARQAGGARTRREGQAQA